ncbi:MAG: FkbM family methyltransferase [Chloroflexi bacterium]|nr:FkbM family methyltransferase [Chloroflexota bacterium]
MLLSRLLYYLSSIPTLLTGIKNLPAIIAALLNRGAHKTFMVELRNGTRFNVRTPMDIWVLKEACLDHQYEQSSVPIQDGWIILDIGAGLGDFAVGVAHAHPHSTVYAYEPFPESYELLQKNLQLNQIQNVQASPCAIGGKAGTTQLQLMTPEAVQHSTASAVGNGRDGITVDSITLDQVFSERKIDRIDYVKMDCEGAEYETFFNASPATLAKIKHICLEHHDGVTPYSHLDLIRFFEQNGFQAKRIPNPVHRDLGLLYAVNSKNI